ncbi:two-component response regulator [Ewingella americana]|uniref:Two-component response regulator n=1 Tax=Ewingella americana TaxID=41202 RepID=A0A377N9T7_9GAMM|nr:two-component response regulator [Ewingella americana]
MKAIIVEDEVLAQEELSYLINAHSEIKIEASFDDGLDVLKYLQTHEVDAISLISTFRRSTACCWRRTSASSRTSLTLSSSPPIKSMPPRLMNRGFRLHSQALSRVADCHHAAKTGDAFKRDKQALTQPAPSSNRASHSINLIKDERIIVTDINDIYYAAAQEKVTQVYTRKEEFTMPMNITELCNRLPEEHFFRCHRSYCVNLSKIREIVPWFNNTYILRLSDLDFEVPVSRSKVKEFRTLMRF